MPDRLGPRRPADPEQARRNREAVRALVQQRDPALARAVREAVPARRTARSR